MKLTKRHAALFTATILALGLTLMPRAVAVADNEDSVVLAPGGVQYGDPDTGGQDRAPGFWLVQRWLSVIQQSVALRLKPASATRPVTVRAATSSRPQLLARPKR
jgi:hypothetical protein